jgi:hypothetical protein
MRRLLCFGTVLAGVVAAIALVVPTGVLAAGAYMRKPPVKVTASMIPSLPDLSPSTGITASQILGGCGGRRTRDPQTHKCRGPADFGN